MSSEPAKNLKTLSDLREDQLEALEFMLDHTNGVYILMPVGAGKTVVTLTACDLWIRWQGFRILVIGTLRIAENVWPREVHEWEHLLHLRVEVATGTPANRCRVIAGDAPIVTINYENLTWLLDTYDVSALFDVVIFDEVTKMKSTKSRRWKQMKPHISRFRRRVGLTGTPTSNGLIDLFGQVYCVDGGASLGEYFTRFRKEHFDAEVKPNYVVYHPKEDALEDIFDKIQPVTYQMDPDKYELPPLMTTVHRATMNAAVAEKYKHIQNEFVLELADDMIIADSTAAMSMKLQQIAGGFIYNENKGTHWLGDHKLEVLCDILEGRNGQPTLVVYRFRAELKKLLNMSVNEIELSVRAANCLNNANITTVGELAMKSEQEMLKYRNFGKKSLNEIKDKLESLGLSLGMKFDERLLDMKKDL